MLAISPSLPLSLTCLHPGHQIQIQINSTSTHPSLEPADLSISYIIYLPLVNQSPSSGFSGFVQSDGGVSMEAAHFSRNESHDGASFLVIPGYSPRARSGGVQVAPVVGSRFEVGSGPHLEYDFYTFSNKTVSVLNFSSPFSIFLPGSTYRLV